MVRARTHRSRSSLGGAGAGIGSTSSRALSLAVTAALVSLVLVPASVRARASAPGTPVAATVRAGMFVGQGFDTCAAPSLWTMRQWLRSPYRAIGIYIGGVNVKCAQPNLTAWWVKSVARLGWHLIPTWVGLQPPDNECHCRPIIPRLAVAQGRGAAATAASAARALGLARGSVLYDDMESYGMTVRNASAALAFLSGWTSGLHAAGYRSGAYGSAGSETAGLLAREGTGYLEPDDVWYGWWDGIDSLTDGAIPSGTWTGHLIHQYSGPHAVSFGGATLTIEGDYLDVKPAPDGYRSVGR